MLHEDQGHLYVCGDVRAARDVARTLKQLVATALSLTEEQVEDYFFQLKVGPLACGLGMQAKDMGQGARAGGVRLTTVWAQRNPRGGGRSELVGLLEGLTVHPGLAAHLNKGKHVDFSTRLSEPLTGCCASWRFKTGREYTAFPNRIYLRAHISWSPL